MPILRRALLEAGRRLQVAGILSEVEDVFHLNLEELEAVPLPDRLNPPMRTGSGQRLAIARLAAPSSPDRR